MKVYPNKLADELKKGGRRVFVVSGDELLLVQECCDLIRSTLSKTGYSERDLFHVDSKFDWGSVLYSGNSMSLFAEKKLIEIRMASAKPGDAGGKALTALVNELDADTALLIVLPRVDQGTQRTKWFKSIESAAAFVQVWPVEAHEMPRWLEGRFRQAGLKASREAILAMAQRVEGNLLAAVQEIARLKLIVSGDKVELDDVVEGVADSARYDVFKLIDSAFLGDVTRSIRMASGLRAEGVDVLFIVNMLARELRSLEVMKSDINSGQSPRDVLKRARVWDKRVPMVTKCLERHDVAGIRDMQVRLGRIDRMVKGILPGDPFREIQLLITTLAGAHLLPAAS